MLGLTLELLLTHYLLPKLSSLFSLPLLPTSFFKTQVISVGYVRASSVPSVHFGHDVGICLVIYASVGTACLGIMYIPRLKHRPIELEFVKVVWQICNFT